jgi:hypothetical protein
MRMNPVDGGFSYDIQEHRRAAPSARDAFPASL